MKASATCLLSISALLCQTVVAQLDCARIRVDQTNFDLSKLSGPHSIVVRDEDRPPSIYNTTWTIDICGTLKKNDSIPAADQCQTGTNVCGIVKSWNPVDDPDAEHVEVLNVISVAGSFKTDHGKSLEPVYTRLKATNINADGVLIELHGGLYGKRKQKAAIQFECDRNRTGNEEFEGAERKRDEGEGQEDIKSLQFISYGPVGGKEEDTDLLRLDWKTKYACEDYNDHKNEGKKGGWGFFTWFILIAFLGIAAYLIFGSWLNYNRYGARGWDLLPHGDTIRDVPYLFKDWSRKVVDTVSGGGSRGGYSAV